mmetsp:Transcript_13632/g.30983  ORF Transcript_13632/g.30983 Transcript_13632/m.30983 type:complete len:396 (-) Transcript_13632:149-1336(-)
MSKSFSDLFSRFLCATSCHNSVPTNDGDDYDDAESRNILPIHPRGPRERGVVKYQAELHLPLAKQPLRVGEVLWLPGDGQQFCRATLALYPNGFSVVPQNPCEEPGLGIAWSPFSLVQACRLHTQEADLESNLMRLFKVSVFHHGSTHFFAVEGDGADEERARWVADVACALRILTQSLFPPFGISAQPIQGLGWTATRILAGYLLQCEERDVRLVYGELHGHWEATAIFSAYEDESCRVRVMRVNIDLETVVSERMAIDCSCFSLHGHHFTARTCAEKALWLRAISNVKVKLRHSAMNPTPTELSHFRTSVMESAKRLPEVENNKSTPALLPRRVPTRGLAEALGDVDEGDEVPWREPLVHQADFPIFALHSSSRCHNPLSPQKDGIRGPTSGW